MDVLLIAFLTLLNGAFAMSELAIASSRKARLAAMAESGDKGALAAVELHDEPTRFLSTVQIGITSIGMLNGIVGEAAFSGGLSLWLQGWGLGSNASHILATAIVITLITFVTIIFGELVPKRIGQLYPEPVARLVARPMRWLALATGPFVRLLTVTTQGTLKLLRIDNDAARTMTEEEISASLEEGVDAGVIEQQEHRMVQNVFHLDDRSLASMMVPRSDMTWLDADQTVAQALSVAGESGHGRYPVCRGGLDDVVGTVSVAALLREPDRQRRIEGLAAPAVFVPETLSGMELLERFRSHTTRILFVVDEYGVLQGMLTTHDLLEAITGELKPRTLDEAWATRRADGSWLLDGLMPLAELKAQLDLRELPDEDRGRYNTLAGLLMTISGKLPATGERVELDPWIFEVVDLDGKRIDKVLAMRAGPPVE